MNLPANTFEQRTVARFERGQPLLPQLFHLLFDRRLVDADHFLVLGRGNAKRLAEGGQQVLFVQLRIALNGLLIFDALRNLPKFLNGLLFQLVIGVSHLSRTSAGYPGTITAFDVRTQVALKRSVYCGPSMNRSTFALFATCCAIVTAA